MSYKYTSALRVNSANLGDLEKNLSKYKDSFDEIFFFSQFTHSVKNLDYHRSEAEKIRPYLQRIKGMGIKAGVNVLATIGFFPEALDSSLEKVKHYVNQDGSGNPGRLCPSDKANIEYIKEQYRIYARLSPDIIYVDDDISSLACACDSCIERFAKLNPDIFKDVSVSRKVLNDLLNSSDSEVRTYTRKAWIRYNSLRIGELYKNIETAVHEINPSIRLGAMTHMSGSDGLDSDGWAEQLSSETVREIHWRPGGGVYTDYSLPDVYDKANRISAQIRYLPENATCVESEMENFPYQSLRKSPSFTAFEGFIYQASGCTGTAFNVLCKEEEAGLEHERFFKMAEDAREYGTLLTETFGREPLCGAGFWWDKDSASFPTEEIWNMGKSVPSAVNIHQVGIPYACEHGNMSVFFFDGNTALQIPEDELKKCLSKGVLLNGEAVDVLNRRGFGEYIGFKTTGCFTSDTLEQEIEHPLNMPGAHRRNPRQAFDWSTKEAYTIEKTNEKAEYLSEHRDLYENIRGMGAGIFENSLGGRVCVEGITPFDWYYSLPRSVHLKNVIRWLSKGSIPAYVDSFHRAAVWVRGNAAFIANMSMENAENLRLCLKTEVETVSAVITCGSKIVKTEKIEAKESFDGFSVFEISAIPITGTALFLKDNGAYTDRKDS